MKLPLNSVKKYAQLPANTQESIDILANRVGEVESFRNLADKYKDIVIAQIKEKQEHPDADKLTIYIVNIGDKEDIQVVAGDKNLEIGDKVAFIQPGGVVPSSYDTKPFQIQAVKMRGEMSNGMLCSEKELDIGPNHENVLKLPEDAPIGEAFADYYELNDTVVEIENKALTNRGDLFGILGLSRELAGAQGIKFISPNWYQEYQINLEPKNVCLNMDLDNQAQALCQRYCAIAMTDIEMKESPIWLKSILIRSGIKPINIVVDITNYLMIVTGQPLHVFDFDKVIKTDTDQADMAHLVIRTANSGEKIHALDGNVYELNDRHLLIANSEHPIAIAGIVGGVDTQIDSNSKSIILESANFDRYSLRRTSMDLGTVTEASTRFTRSQSPQLCNLIIAKAVELITELTGAKLATTLIDLYPTIQEPKTLSLNTNKLREILGVDITDEEVIKILDNIEYKDIELKDEYLTVTVPPFRQDIEIEEDIYEDIIRIYGYSKIEPILPKRDITATSMPDITKLKNSIRDILSNSGCNELLSYSFTSIEFLNSIKQDVDNCLKIKNPLSKELELMRSSILSSLLEKAKLNTQNGIRTFSIFEMGIPHQKDVLDEENLPLEEWRLALLFTDSSKQIEGNPYFQAKRYLEKVLNNFNVGIVEYELLADVDFEKLPKWLKDLSGSFEFNSSAIVWARVGGSKIDLGIVGEITSEVKSNLSIYSFTSAFEMNLNKLLLIKDSRFNKALESRYPYITQDICFVVPNKVTYKELLDNVEKSVGGESIVFEIECIDIYKESDSRNITLRISLSNLEKTLRDKDFRKIRERISKNLEKKNISMIQ